MKVREAIAELATHDMEADLVICAHAWAPGQGWVIQGFEEVTDDDQRPVGIVLIEGAGPLEESTPKPENN
jgi:hypothetical protein